MRYILLTFIGLVGLIQSSCIEDDFTTSPSDILTFSRDTVSFDTVFTDLGTPTARLLVYNRAKKSVNISHIAFKRGDESNFQVNVDGMTGKTFQDVEIRGGDSIYVFVECFIDETLGKEPYLVEDKLQFVTNGVTQEVQVEAYGQNVTRLRDLRITSDMRLTAERPYVIFDSLVVEKGVKLTIDPGTRMLFHDKASLTVRGQIEAIGEVGNMIQMRGDRLDNVLPDVAYDIMAGQWHGIRIEADSYDNRMEYVNMRSTVIGLQVDSCAVTDRRKLTLVNSWLHNSQSSAITSRYAWVDALGCCFSEAAAGVVELWGGKHLFAQCTISNYYLFSGMFEPLLCLYHCLPDSDISDQPLMQASFENSILYGMTADINEGDLTGSNVYLRNVLLKSAGSDDANFISCVWDSDPLFYTIREDYIFDYRLRNDSPAIGAGQVAFIPTESQTDMYGNSRTANGAPDLGAFVWIYAPDPEPTE